MRSANFTHTDAFTNTNAGESKMSLFFCFFEFVDKIGRDSLIK